VRLINFHIIIIITQLLPAHGANRGCNNTETGTVEYEPTCQDVTSVNIKYLGKTSSWSKSVVQTHRHTTKTQLDHSSGQ